MMPSPLPSFHFEVYLIKIEIVLLVRYFEKTEKKMWKVLGHSLGFCLISFKQFSLSPTLLWPK